nr:vegetative cell wall protein gp1-like [Aegilops tauschii subsp. strangulata]
MTPVSDPDPPLFLPRARARTRAAHRTPAVSASCPPPAVLPRACPRRAAPAAARGSGRPVLASPRLVYARARRGRVRPSPTPRCTATAVAAPGRGPARVLAAAAPAPDAAALHHCTRDAPASPCRCGPPTACTRAPSSLLAGGHPPHRAVHPAIGAPPPCCSLSQPPLPPRPSPLRRLPWLWPAPVPACVGPAQCPSGTRPFGRPHHRPLASCPLRPAGPMTAGPRPL